MIYNEFRKHLRVETGIDNVPARDKCEIKISLTKLSIMIYNLYLLYLSTSRYINISTVLAIYYIGAIFICDTINRLITADREGVDNSLFSPKNTSITFSHWFIMGRLSSLILLAILSACSVSCHFNLPLNQKASVGNVGTPLVLTSLIKQGKIQEAQSSAAVVIENFEDVKSYSGYFTVNAHHDSNLFFWFFPSQNNPENDPVLLWLQGGPGASGMFGMFVENGPFYTTDGVNLKRREWSWTRNHSVLYVDNPVGTGFSYTNGGYAQNQTRVGKELYKFLQQFFTMFPDLQKNQFFITGESYAGKYGPAIAYAIMKNNPSADLKINLQGISLGNPLVDPIHQFKFGEYLYEVGLIDINTRKIFLEYQEKGRSISFITIPFPNDLSFGLSKMTPPNFSVPDQHSPFSTCSIHIRKGLSSSPIVIVNFPGHN